MRGAVLGSGVRLDLDDPADPAHPPPLANEQRPEEAARRLVDGSREQAAQVDGAAQLNCARRSDGTIQPKSAKKSGMNEERNRPTTWDES